MKYKYITIILLLLFITSTGKSQQFHGGIVAGVAGTQVAGDNFSGFNKAGIFAGGFVSLNVGEKSSLRMELTFFQKGSRENPTEKNGYISYLFRVNYIELPVLYEYQAGRFTVFAGPSAGFLMGYYEQDTYLNVISDEPGYIKPARVTLQINLGFRFAISPKMGVDFRTNNSILNIYSANQTGDVRRFGGLGRYSDALVLSMYYQFR